MKFQLLNEKWIIWLHMMCKREAPMRNGLCNCTLEILMLDHQLSHLHILMKFSLSGSFLGGHQFFTVFLLTGLPLFLSVCVAVFEPLGASVQVHSGKRGTRLFTTKLLFSEQPFS